MQVVATRRPNLLYVALFGLPFIIYVGRGPSLRQLPLQFSPDSLPARRGLMDPLRPADRRRASGVLGRQQPRVRAETLAPEIQAVGIEAGADRRLRRHCRQGVPSNRLHQQRELPLFDTD